MTDTLQRWLRPEIAALSAYHVPDSTGLVKLDAMENPYRWPSALVEAWLEVLRAVELNRYPAPSAPGLKQALRAGLGLPENQPMILGNGSDELIQLLALAVAGRERTVLAPEPSFVMYRMIASFAGMRYTGVPLRADDFALDIDASLAAVDREQPALIFLAYPNNPTGNLWERAAIESIIEAAPGLVVIDEAYGPFATDSFIGDLDRHPNLMVMRTVSKQGLAGLRLGLLCGDAGWLEQLDKIRLPYNINVLTQASARFAMEHIEVLEQQAAAIRRDREQLSRALAALDAVAVVYPSQANFILFRVGPGRGTVVFDGLREAGVLIKNLSPAGGLLADCLRVTVGTPDENARFLEALASVLAVAG
jgi:histidinol-phosphate aminotransferase